MSDCKWCKDEMCVNAASPLCADFCPVPKLEGFCLYEDRTPAIDWEQEYYNERDRFDRLSDFEVAEAEELAKLKANTQNVVITQFQKGGKKYLFSLPERSKIRKGQELVLTSNPIGYACRDSFFVGGDALDALVDVMGAKLPLAPVSAVVLRLTPDAR